MQDFLTIEEAAKRLEMHPATLRRYIREGKLKAKKLGKEYRINRHDFDIFSGGNISKGNLSDKLLFPHPGVYSLIIETLLELKDNFQSLDDIFSTILELNIDYIPNFQKAKKEYPTISSPQEFILKLAERDAKRNIELKKEIIEKLFKKEAAVFLPLPPHIYDALYVSIPQGYLFNTEEKVPHHLEKAPFENLPPHFVPEVLTRIGSLPYLITDGQKIGNKLFVRSSVATIISYMLSQNLKKIYFHNIPHIPKKQHFVSVNLDNIAIQIDFI